MCAKIDCLLRTKSNTASQYTKSRNFENLLTEGEVREYMGLAELLQYHSIFTRVEKRDHGGYEVWE